MSGDTLGSVEDCRACQLTTTGGENDGSGLVPARSPESPELGASESSSSGLTWESGLAATPGLDEMGGFGLSCGCCFLIFDMNLPTTICSCSLSSLRAAHKK